MHPAPEEPSELAPDPTLSDDDLRQDWKYEVANGDTSLGFAEWKQHQEEMQAATDSPSAAT